MAIPISYPLVNGHRYSWASVEITYNGKVYRGVKSIDYGDELSPGKMKGTGVGIIGRTRGDYDADANLEMYRLEFENLKQDLSNNGQIGFGEVAVTITVSYAEQGQPVVTDTLEGVRITKPRTGGQEGNDPTTMKLDLDLMRVLYNGVPLYTQAV